jgi:hypothetical protein
MLEAAVTSATSTNFYQTTRRYNPEDSHIHALWYCVVYEHTTVKDNENWLYIFKNSGSRFICLWAQREICIWADEKKG